MQVDTKKLFPDKYWIDRRLQRMKQLNQKKITLFLVLFGVLFFTIPGNSFAVAESNEEVTEDTDTLLVEGKIRQVNQKQQNVVVKTQKGKKMTILFDWNTSLVGYSSPKKIEKGHEVKIWYASKDQKLTAVKIEKKLMVGCD